jgi:hypothetical protein
MSRSSAPYSAPRSNSLRSSPASRGDLAVTSTMRAEPPAAEISDCILPSTADAGESFGSR